MGFWVEEVDGTPRAVFEDEDPLRRALLPFLLHPDPYFVPDMLYELSLVERGTVESSGFDSPRAEIRFFRDRVVIETAPDTDRDTDPPTGELSTGEAMLLLLEWGAALQRRRLESQNSSGPRPSYSALHLH